MTDFYAPRLSALDEDRFGARTAKAIVSAPAHIDDFRRFCREQAVEFAIVRCPTRELAVVQSLESHGFFLTDTLVYYRRDLTASPIPPDAGQTLIRPARPEEAEDVGAAAAAAFRGYFGHYHADPRLDVAASDGVYADWAARACLSREVADEVLIATDGDVITGLAAMRMVTTDTGDGVLFGVTPSSRGKGVYRSLLIHALHWCRARKAKEMITSTQITNVVPQKVWAGLGFSMSHSYYTFHKWFDAGEAGREPRASSRMDNRIG